MKKRGLLMSAICLSCVIVMLFAAASCGTPHQSDAEEPTTEEAVPDIASYEPEEMTDEQEPEFSLTETERIYGLSTIWRRSAEMSPFIATKPEDFDWDVVFLEFLPKIIDAVDMVEYYETLNRFVARLSDGKSSVVAPDGVLPMYSSPLLLVGYVEDGFVVMATFRSVTDIPLGSEIIYVNGVPTKEFLEEYFGDMMGFYTPIARENRLARHFSLSTRTSEMELKVVTPEGETLQETIHFDITIEQFIELMDDLDMFMPDMGDLEAYYFLDGDVYVHVHDGDIHQISIPHFDGDVVTETVRQYIESVADSARGFILDVRGNTGGGYNLSILSQFVHTEELSMSNAYRQVRDARHMGVAAAPLMTNEMGMEIPDFFLEILEIQEAGRPLYQGLPMLNSRHIEALPFDDAGFIDFDNLNEQSLMLFDVPVVILADYRTGSAGDDFVALAKGADRFTIIGTHTMGATGMLAPFSLPGGFTFMLGTILNTTHDGEQINNHGIAPHIWAEQSRADLFVGRDTQLAAALEYLSEHGE